MEYQNNAAGGSGPENTRTEEQLRAITLRNRKILVSAGAGSGKTRVLVERVLQRIKDDSEPVEVDRLLVVTFTNAAAAEMKQRVGAELERSLYSSPGSSRLRRQMLLLNRAHICTVHSFCLDVIRRYYYLRDLDPSFRVLDETEAALLRQEILEEVLEEHYEGCEPDSSFYRLVDAYSSERGDSPLQELALRLYNFSRSHLWPEKWLREMSALFQLEDAEDLESTPWLEQLKEECSLDLDNVISRLQEAARQASLPGGPSPYLENLEEEIEALREMRRASEQGGWGELFEKLQHSPFGRLKQCKGDEYDAGLREMVKETRNRAKNELQKLQRELFERPLDKQLQDLQKIAPLLSTLVELVEMFGERYSRAKAEKKTVDFQDLEHYALQLLIDPGTEPSEIVPSPAAVDYRDHFAEVLVDEFQDINPVQEAILKLVSRPEPEGNLFMVGDVKQSIYRFRLAEPNIFLQKYREYAGDSSPGERVELSYNFRSRRQVLWGVNFLFSQLMDRTIGEIDYDEAARLRCAADYPETAGEKGEETDLYSPELLLIDRSGTDIPGPGHRDSEQPGRDESDEGEDVEEGRQGEEFPEEDWEKASLEGRLIAQKILELVGASGRKALQLYDGKTGTTRPASYRDVVILLRSAKSRGPAVLEELRLAGIPAYAELETGYFEATEVKVMLSLLSIIDNPFQDIPLAAVLRSPLLGLSAEELGRVRSAQKEGPFYDALYGYCALYPEDETAKKLFNFLSSLERWREEARRGSLSGLIWQLYRETGYYDVVGAMPGGEQRQANLRALYDRARQYESTSFRGLFRFLRFIEKLRDRGGDLGTARALGEGEDVVRVMTVHKSKGLEFPVVFAAGLSGRFNRQDLHRQFLLHKDLGFGPRRVDVERRITYPTLPWHAVKRKLEKELLSEELRIFYVALTRAEEKLFLVSTVNDLAGEVQKWEAAARGQERLLPAFYRRRALCYLDLVGPALLRHPGAAQLRELSRDAEDIKLVCEEENGVEEKENSKLSWKIGLYSSHEIIKALQDTKEGEKAGEKEKEAAVRKMQPLPGAGPESGEVARRLSWRYPYRQATKHFAKVSASEINKHWLAGVPTEDAGEAPWLEGAFTSSFSRPRFLEKEGLSAAETGTAFHVAMQHLDLEPEPSEKEIERQLETMLQKELLTPRQLEALDTGILLQFFNSPLGLRMRKAPEVHREVPFTLALPAAEVYPGWEEEDHEQGCCRENVAGGGPDEQVLVQGVIDCLFREDDGCVLVDYKTAAGGAGEKELLQRYGGQLQLYARAVEEVLKQKVKEKYLYFLKEARELRVK